MFRPRFFAAGAVVTVAITFWLPSVPAQVAEAATGCNSAAGNSGRINFSSKFRTSSVVLCGDWIKVTKPANPTVPKKPVTKPVTKSPGSTIVYTHSVIAAPTKPKITASPSSQVAIDSNVAFRSVSPSVVRYRYLLGIPTQIKFTPVGYFWRFSDGKTSNAKNLRRRITQEAALTANLKVSFSVRFRLASGGAWRLLDRTVQLNAAPVRLNASSSQKPKPRYVLFNCLQRPEAPGC